MPVVHRIGYKIATMTFNCVRGTSPAYFRDVYRPVTSAGARAMLRCADHGHLVEHRPIVSDGLALEKHVFLSTASSASRTGGARGAAAPRSAVSGAHSLREVANL